MRLENFQAGWAPPPKAESQGIYPGTQFMKIPSPHPRTGKYSDHSLILSFKTHMCQAGSVYYGRHE